MFPWLSPDSSARSLKVVLWKPFCEKSLMAARTICSRRFSTNSGFLTVVGTTLTGTGESLFFTERSLTFRTVTHLMRGKKRESIKISISPPRTQRERKQKEGGREGG